MILGGAAGSLAGWLGWLGLWTGCAPPPDVDGPPDVVIVTVDTLRADRLGFMGHAAARTPALDALAASGRVFEQATTPFPRTTPALASLQTGLRPVHHGAREVGQVVTTEVRLARWLGDTGRQTLAVTAMRVAGPDQKLDLGFERFVLDHDARASVLAAEALDAVGDLDVARPMYLWVHFADPHFPYLPADTSGPTVPAGASCRAIGERAASGKFRRDALFMNRDGQAEAILDDCRRLYDGEIAEVDSAVGALLDGLGAARRHRPRIVVFTADHGENQGEGGLYFEHGPDVSMASVHVPMVFAGPGVTAGRDAGVARLEDVAPTLLSLVGAPVPDGLDGVSLGARTTGGAGGPELALVESGSALHPPLFRYLVSGRGDKWCVNEGQWSWCTLPGTAPGLYDHEADPGLDRDVSAANPEIAARLRDAAGRWAPERAHQRMVRTADGGPHPGRDGGPHPGRALIATPTVDGWAESLIDAAGQPVVDDDALAALKPELDALSAAIEAADAPVTGDSAALRELGYIE
ncbi:MAG: sulfatase [Myxococcota bacterium]